MYTLALSGLLVVKSTNSSRLVARVMRSLVRSAVAASCRPLAV